MLGVALTERNPETVKELPAEHRVLEGRAVAVGITKRRRGKALSRQTLHWEVGPESRQLHTPGGFYLLVHELTRRSRGISGTPSLWSVWTGRSGVNGHAAPFGTSLNRSLNLSRWAAAQGLTADTPSGEPGPLVLRLDRLKTAAEARRAKATGGHLPSIATTNTMDVSYLHYLRNDPVIQAWAEDIIDAALTDAEDSARDFQLRVLGPAIQDRFRADPAAVARELGTSASQSRPGPGRDARYPGRVVPGHRARPVRQRALRGVLPDVPALPECPGAGAPPASAVRAARPAAG